MSGGTPDEYELADDPNSDALDADARTEAEPPPAERAKPPSGPAAPLPRMWKVEPEDENDPAVRVKKRRSERSAETSKTRAKSKDDGGEGEKKVLVEETPAFDTYEARQRARMIAGGLVVGIIGLAVYLGYQMLPGSPFSEEELPDEALAQTPIEPARPDLDREARVMFDRAREFARIGRTDEAVALLEKLAKAYRTTKTAGDAREALARPSQNLPLFLDRPTVTADAPTAAPSEPAPAPPVVTARAPEVQAKGDAALVLPANPAEPTPTVEAETETKATTTTPPAAVEIARTLPAGFTAKTEAGMHPSGWPSVIVGDRDGAPMVFVPGGEFTMGDDRDAAFASPAHQVKLSGYYIDQHEVTVRQFRLFLSETHFRGKPPASWSTADEPGKPSTDALPMIMVNAGDARAFAEWAGKSLPTEAQWELASRSNDGRAYPWGDEPATFARPRTARQVDPVMTFPKDRSPFGVFDMGGNVHEWTSDAFDPSYYRSIAGQVVVDPPGAAPRSGRSDLVVKGGKGGAGSAREPMAAEKRLTYVGFRCALQVERPSVIANPVPTAPIASPTPGQAPSTPRPQPADSAPPPVPF